MSALTVLTASMPGREDLLARACRSVSLQRVPVSAHLIRVQEPAALSPLHLAYQRNELCKAVTTDWVAPLDDDDQWLPNHVEVWRDTLEAHPDADVIYTWPDPPWAITRLDCTGWPQLALKARLRQSNFVPSSAFVRKGKLAEVGGWSTGPYSEGRYSGTGATWEDWDLWTRLADADAVFVCAPVVTWHYELEGGHRHAIAAEPDERDRGMEGIEEEVMAW